MKQTMTMTHNSAGAQTASAAKRRFVIPRGRWRLRDSQARLNTAPVGAAFLIDLNKNGTTIFTAQGDRITIADGANASGTFRPQAIGVFASGDVLSYDVDQIGSGTAGSDLDITFYFERN